MAPEIIKNIEGNYSAKLSDIWSCGVVLYVMLVGQYPFSRDEDFSLSENKRQKVVCISHPFSLFPYLLYVN